MRYCIAKDGKKWRVYDDYRKEFAEPIEAASDKSSARERAAKMNEHYAQEVGAEKK